MRMSNIFAIFFLIDNIFAIFFLKEDVSLRMVKKNSSEHQYKSVKYPVSYEKLKLKDILGERGRKVSLDP